MVADTPLSGASPLPHLRIEYSQSGQRTVRPPSMMAAPMITARRWVSWLIQKLLKKHSPMWEGACPGTDRRHPLRLKPETSFTCINHGQEVTGHVMESRVPDGSKSQIDRRLAVRRLFKTSTGIELRH